MTQFSGIRWGVGWGTCVWAAAVFSGWLSARRPGASRQDPPIPLPGLTGICCHSLVCHSLTPAAAMGRCCTCCCRRWRGWLLRRRQLSRRRSNQLQWQQQRQRLGQRRPARKTQPSSTRLPPGSGLGVSVCVCDLGRAAACVSVCEAGRRVPCSSMRPCCLLACRVGAGRRCVSVAYCLWGFPAAASTAAAGAAAALLRMPAHVHSLHTSCEVPCELAAAGQRRVALYAV